MYLIMNLVGLGLGPPLIGLISDRLTRAAVAETLGPAHIESCTRLAAAAPACVQAAGLGISHALVVISLMLLIAVAHFWQAGRLIGRKGSTAS